MGPMPTLHTTIHPSTTVPITCLPSIAPPPTDRRHTNTTHVTRTTLHTSPAGPTDRHTHRWRNSSLHIAHTNSPALTPSHTTTLTPAHHIVAIITSRTLKCTALIILTAHAGTAPALIIITVIA